MNSLRTIVAITAGLALCQASDVLASAFRVTPVQVQLSGKSSTLLTLANETNEPLRFQISAFAWKQSPTGEIQLEPTEDISFFPALLTLGGGQERKVRVGSNVVAGDVEKTYRIFFEELPAAERPDKKSSEVRILTKMGIPIFVQPAKPVAEARIEDVKVEAGALQFRIANSGNAHFSIQRLSINGTTAVGEQVLDRALDGWYVLAGGHRDYRVDLPAGVCPKLQSVKIRAITDISTISEAASTVTMEKSFTPGSGCTK